MAKKNHICFRFPIAVLLTTMLYIYYIKILKENVEFETNSDNLQVVTTNCRGVVAMQWWWKPTQH